MEFNIKEFKYHLTSMLRMVESMENIQTEPSGYTGPKKFANSDSNGNYEAEHYDWTEEKNYDR